MKIRYFAWMREHTGVSSEELVLPAKINTVGQLAEHLKAMSDGHKIALRNMKTVRVAVNQQYAQLDSQISDHDEVAFFPPVTGG
jgi:molybdopterin synthase sulfur carrier subunit